MIGCPVGDLSDARLVVTVSSEVPAQTQTRLRGSRSSQDAWLPGSWEFVEGAEAAGLDDAIAVIDGRIGSG